MTFDEAVQYLEGFINYEKRPIPPRTVFKLERMKKFLANLGNPQDELKIIHVAGTKGKGSTASAIAHILKEQGFRVGLYTSPHLIDFRERIRVLDPHNSAETHQPFSGMILKNEFAELLERMKPQIDFFRRSFQGFGALTFFEILTAMALRVFVDKKADWVVLETGLGGRLDATNATCATVCVITPIGFDHESILGTTLAEIAFEKAGIIKSANHRTKEGAGVVIAAKQAREVAQVLRRRARSEGACLFELGRDFTLRKLEGDLAGQKFYYRGLDKASHFFRTRLLGDHQLINQSCAVAAVEALRFFGTRISSDAIERGLLSTLWPGRLEVVRTRPFMVLDGAHNRESAGRLARFVSREFKKMRKWVIVGACEDKDVAGILGELEPLADKIVLTRSQNPRAVTPERLQSVYLRRPAHALTQTVEEALGLVERELAPEDVVVVTGSLFVVGEAKAAWHP